MDDLTFRVTPAQIRSLLLMTAGSGVAAAVLMRIHLAGHDPSGEVLGFGIGAGAVMLLAGCCAIMYSRAFTECTPAGICTRGLGLKRCVSWDQVIQVSVRPGRVGSTRTVVVQMAGGAEVTLGAPVTGGVMPDREFDRKVGEIHRLWQQRAGWADPGLPIPVSVASPARLPLSAQVRAVVVVILLGAIAALPVVVRQGGPALLVRLGQGERGSYTGYLVKCSGSCVWVGEFTARGGVSRDGVTIAPGANLTRIGDHVPAVYDGDQTMVYPAGGGTGWIPLAIVLAMVTGCLAVLVPWLLGRTARTRRAPGPGTGKSTPDLASHGQGVTGIRRAVDSRALHVPSGRVVIEVATVGVVVAGVIVAVFSQPVSQPVASAGMRACADYSQWMDAQHGTGLPVRDPALLERAQLEAPNGPLSADLDALTNDLSVAAQPTGAVQGIVESLSVTNDMSAVTRDCFSG